MNNTSEEMTLLEIQSLKQTSKNKESKYKSKTIFEASTRG